jgi:hypothetical protein
MNEYFIGRLKRVPSQIYWAGGLAVITLLSRLPFYARIMYHWDCINFALALEEFNLSREQPQPPGYVLYVVLGRIVNVIIHDPPVTLLIISMLSSALAVVALFCLGKVMFEQRVGLVAALLLSSSPLFWFYGEISLPHTLDALLVIVSVWWLYQVMNGRMGYLIPAALVLAIAGGVRQQTLVFLAPLALFAVRRIGIKRLLLMLIVGALVCLAWFVPLMHWSGGVGKYLEITGAFTRRFQSTTSVFMGGGWWGIRRNLIKLTMYTLFAWSLALIPSVIYAAKRLFHREWPRDWERVLFLSLWIVPTVAFYTLIHMGQQGLVFVFLPALLLLSAVGLLRLLGGTREKRWVTSLATVGLVICNSVIFCLAPEYPLGGDRWRLLTRATLANSDRYYGDRFEAIEENFDSRSTAILADDWRHTEYYLSNYTSLHFDIVSKWEQGEGKPVGSPEMQVSLIKLSGPQRDEQGQMSIVVFDPVLEPFNVTPERLRMLPLTHGGTLGYFVLTMDEAFQYGAGSFGAITR